MLSTILFDLDATLVDDGANWRRSVRETLETIVSLHPACSVDRLSDTYYDAAGRVWEQIRDVEAPPFGNMDDPSIVRRVLSLVLEDTGVGSPKTLETAVATYLDHRSAGAPAFDDAQECLQQLSQRYRLGIVTNGLAAQQMPKLEASGLSPFFGVVTTTDGGHGKPRPGIFLEALAALSATPADAAYVGDSLSWDVGGANRAGMKSIWLNRRGAARKPDSPDPDAEITSLRDLPAALEALSSD